MSYVGKRGFSERRLLGDTRREVVEAHHVAASKRRRLAGAAEDEEDDGRVQTLGDNDGAVFADAVYEQDDIEADQIYAAVEKRVNARSNKLREQRLKEEQKQQRRANPNIQQQFADLKAELGSVSAEQWASIPDIGDYSVKKTKFEKYTPAPDSLLESARRETAYVTAEPGNFGTATDLASIGAGRVSVLGQKLDKAGDSHTGNAAVDADGYLNEMAGVRVSTQTEIGDIKKARLLLKSVTATNPTHAPGWIAVARLEETAGKLSTAQELILQGCRKCPRDEDVWIEAARLYPKETGRRILAQAVRTVPRSEKIWLQAATLEDEVNTRRRVLRKALEIMPRSVRLWKAAVELEEPTGARILLSRAVECVPKSTELWLALARLENYEQAKESLRRAQDAISTDPAICITAAELEETQNGEQCPEIQTIIQRGVTALSQTEEAIGREKWLETAEEADEAGYPGTVKAIIESTIGLGVADADAEAIWTKDANALETKGRIAAARAVYDRLTRTYPMREDLWLTYADFERRVGESRRVRDVLSEAVNFCPKSVVPWLMLAKDEWKTHGVESGRRVLSRALEHLPDSPLVWVASAKLETKSGEFAEARATLNRARRKAASEMVFMKSALLERGLRLREAEKRLLVEGIATFPSAVKLWLMLAQWYERGDKTDELNGVLEGSAEDGKTAWVQKLSSAKAVYHAAVERCRTSTALWIGYARHEEKMAGTARARAVLERGREACKGQDDVDVLWREGACLAARAGDFAAARVVVARGLGECGGSGLLWAVSIALEGKKAQKARSADGIRACPESGVVLLEVARYFWRGGRVAKAREWFERAVKVDAEIGDCWAGWVAFETEVGGEVEEVVKKAVRAEPRYGEAWISVRKKIGNEWLDVREVLMRVAGLVGKESNVTGIYDS